MSTRTRLSIWIVCLGLVVTTGLIGWDVAGRQNFGLFGIRLEQGVPEAPELRKARTDAQLTWRVVGVLEGSPAATAGVRRLDLLISVDGVPLQGSEPAFGPAARLEPGKTVTLELERDGERYRAPLVGQTPAAIKRLELASRLGDVLTNLLKGVLWLAVGAAVFWKRPDDRRALVLFLMSAAATELNLVELAPWGFSAADSLGRFASYALDTRLVLLLLEAASTMLFLAFLFHLSLIFPGERPIVRTWPKLELYVYGLPLVLYAGLCLASLIAADAWWFLVRLPDAEVQAVRQHLPVLVMLALFGMPFFGVGLRTGSVCAWLASQPVAMQLVAGPGIVVLSAGALWLLSRRLRWPGDQGSRVVGFGRIAVSGLRLMVIGYAVVGASALVLPLGAARGGLPLLLLADGIGVGVALSFVAPLLCLIAVCIGYPVGSCVMLRQSYREADLSARKQIAWPLWGIISVVISYLLIHWSVLVLGRLLSVHAGIQFDGQLTLQIARTLLPPLVPLSFAVALFRYRLMDIEPLIRGTVIYGVVTGVVVLGVEMLSQVAQTALTAEAGLSNFWLAVIAALIITLMLKPLKDGVQRVLDRRFYPQHFDFDGARRRVRKTLLEGQALEPSLNRVVELLQQTLQCRNTVVLLKEGEPHRFRVAAQVGLAEDGLRAMDIPISALGMEVSAETRQLETADLPAAARDALRGIDSVRLIPVRLRGQVLALLSIGGRPRGAVDPGELELLDEVADQLALALGAPLVRAEQRSVDFSP